VVSLMEISFFVSQKPIHTGRGRDSRDSRGPGDT
jgi:hypothetical protein